MDLLALIVLFQVNKQVEGKISWIRDQWTKSRKYCVTKEVAYACRYTSGCVTPNSVTITYTEE